MASISKQCKRGTLHLIKIPKKYKVQVAQTAERALVGASELFIYRKPVETVIFCSIPGFVIPEVGVGADATTQGDIVVNIDFSRRDIKRTIQRELSPTLYHEFSHVVRASVHKNLYATLGESLVTEGIASYIEKKVFRKRVSYIESIEKEKKYWFQAQKNLHKKKYNYDEWFFGRGKFPRWIGYRLGYLLIDSFMKQQQDLSLSQLVRTKSREILLGSRPF